jgi:ATP-dependent RNA helicase DeaD
MSNAENPTNDSQHPIGIVPIAVPLFSEIEVGAGDGRHLSVDATSQHRSNGEGTVGHSGHHPTTAVQAKRFDDLPIPREILAQLRFETTTDIQAEAIPPALYGRDILATSQTGSGKTLAYGIPLIAHLLADPARSGLVLTPTRELAIQVMAELSQLIPASTIRTALLIGGQPNSPQNRQLRNGARLIVGTPGRIKEHLDSGSLKLHATQVFVLDEADRMLDMGFKPQIFAIAAALREVRQTLLFSATMSGAVEKIANGLLYDPVRVKIGESNIAAQSVTQRIISVDNKRQKQDVLGQILQEQTGTVLIFVRTKYGTERLAETIGNLWQKPASFLHGDLDQREREAVIAKLRGKAISILVATDLAGRGLDVPHIECVINFDLPHDPENYVHRIGRTGRAGASGIAITLLAPEDKKQWRVICKFISVEPIYSGEIGSRPGHVPSEILSSQTNGTATDFSAAANRRHLDEPEPDLIDRIPDLTTTGVSLIGPPLIATKSLETILPASAQQREIKSGFAEDGNLRPSESQATLDTVNGTSVFSRAQSSHGVQVEANAQHSEVPDALKAECCIAAIELVEAFNDMGGKLSGRTINLFRTVEGVGRSPQSVESAIKNLRITREEALERLDNARNYLVAAVTLCNNTTIPFETMIEALRVYASAKTLDRVLANEWLSARDDVAAASKGSYRASTIQEARTRVMTPVIQIILNAHPLVL